MKKIDWFLAVVVVIVIGVFVGRGVLNNEEQKTKPTEKEMPKQAEVEVEEIELADFLIPSSYIGNAQQFTGIDIKPNISGFLTAVNVDGGQYVKTGDVLFEVDNRTYKAMVNEAVSNVNKAKADLENATSYYERIKNTKKGAVSQNVIDNAKAQFLEAQSMLNQAKAQLKNAEVNLDYTTLTAPNNGYLGDVSVSVGDYVSEQTSLAYLLEYSPIKVVFSIPQKDFAKFVADDFSDKWVKLKGRDKKELPNNIIRMFLDNQVNQETSSVLVYLRVDNDKKNLLPGSYVNVVVEKPVKDGIKIDKNKVEMLPDGNFVYLLKDGVITQQKVKIGGYLDYQYYISEGLKDGDLLINSAVASSMVGKKAEAKK